MVLNLFPIGNLAIVMDKTWKKIFLFDDEISVIVI